MADRVRIANLMLAKLGESDRLISPDDNTKPAREIAAIWDISRQAVLRLGAWNFATRRAELAAQALTPPATVPLPWTHQFPRPPEFLRLLDVYDPALAERDYALEADGIMARVAGPLRIRYIADITDTTKWDGAFTEAFAAYGAWQIADNITGDSGRKKDAWANYQWAIAEAKRTDALENPPEPFPDSDWITCRLEGDIVGGNGVWVR